MSFFKKGDRILIKYCVIRDYIGLTGTVISHTKDNIHVAIDEKFHNTLNKKHWIVEPTFNGINEIVPIGAKILKNE